MDWHPRGNRLRVESRRYARYINVTNSVKRTMLRTEKVGKVERKRGEGEILCPYESTRVAESKYLWRFKLHLPKRRLYRWPRGKRRGEGASIAQLCQYGGVI